MALLERVATLVRANLNDLLERAEDPEKLVKQVILDMENQLLQVKTQVAIGIADQHVLQTKQAEQEEQAAEWMRRAALAVDKQEDDLARAALARAMSYRRLEENYARQATDHTAQIEHLKTYPLVRNQVAAGRLRLHGWWFELHHADVHAYDEAAGRFILIDDLEAERLLARFFGPASQPAD